MSPARNRPKSMKSLCLYFCTSVNTNNAHDNIKLQIVYLKKKYGMKSYNFYDLLKDISIKIFIFRLSHITE